MSRIDKQTDRQTTHIQYIHDRQAENHTALFVSNIYIMTHRQTRQTRQTVGQTNNHTVLFVSNISRQTNRQVRQTEIHTTCLCLIYHKQTRLTDIQTYHHTVLFVSNISRQADRQDRQTSRHITIQPCLCLIHHDWRTDKLDRRTDIQPYSLVCV